MPDALSAPSPACAVCTVANDERVAVGSEWFVSVPGGDAPLAGWIAVAPNVHRETLADLSPDEAASLGPILRDLSAGVMAETGAPRTYVANWAEGTRHVHFHVIPREADLPGDRLGYEVFRLLNDDIPHPPREEQQRVLRAVVRTTQRSSA